MDNEPRSSAEDDDMELIKVTLGYCPHEDRVRMDGLGSTAGTIRTGLPPAYCRSSHGTS